MQNELKKQYAGVFDEWKIDLALRRIMAMGFVPSDWPDLMQELAIVMLGFRYDPAKANGATEETALYAVINKSLLHHLRTRCRESAKIRRYARELGVKADGTGEEPFCLLDAPMQMDVAHVCAHLDEFDQKVCSAIAAGNAKAQIARKIDCDWHTVKKAVGRIMKHFEAHGLKYWVCS